MTWGEPWYLLGVVGVFTLAALSWWWRRRLTMALASLGAPTRVGRRRERVRQVLLWGGLALVAVALAGPRWGSVTSVRTASGADVLLLIDCSRSMLADDLYPSRIEMARRKALDLLHVAPGTRLALMPFAAIPVLRCPLTGDHEALATMLADCDPELFPAKSGYQGTAIGASVQEGLRVLGRQVERGQAILIVSDGADDHPDTVAAAAAAAKSAGVPVLGLFLGDPEKTVKLTIDGKEEVMTADRSTLETLALATGGVCVNAVLDDRDVRALADHLAQSAASRPWEERQRLVASERYQWALIPGVMLLIMGALVATRRRLA